MNTIVHTTDASPSTTRTELASAPLPFPVDSSPFLNWREDQNETDDEKAVVFQSLVATLKCQPVLDASLEAKAVKFLESVDPPNAESADDFLDTLASITDESMTEFVQSIVTLISSPSLAIIKAAMKMLKSVVSTCSDSFLLVLLEADLIPTLITSLNLQSLSFTEAEDIHTCLMITFVSFLWLATPFSLPQLEIKDDDGQQAVHETVLQQVIAPSEKYIRHLCVNHFSIVDGEQSKRFLVFLSKFLEISRCHQPTMDFVLHMPLFFTIPSCLTFFKDNEAIWYFLFFTINSQREWSKTKGAERQIWKKVHRMLRMEGFEDVMEQYLKNGQNPSAGSHGVAESIELNNLQGMNLVQSR